MITTFSKKKIKNSKKQITQTGGVLDIKQTATNFLKLRDHLLLQQYVKNKPYGLTHRQHLEAIQRRYKTELIDPHIVHNNWRVGEARQEPYIRVKNLLSYTNPQYPSAESIEKSAKEHFVKLKKIINYGLENPHELRQRSYYGPPRRTKHH